MDLLVFQAFFLQLAMQYFDKNYLNYLQLVETD
jgi:hypothetical protein